MSEITYLACPYTDPDPEVRRQRYQCANSVAAKLIKQGIVLYSPITMTHPIDELLAGEGATLGTEYWLEFDQAFMEACSTLVVLRLPGWEESAGVQREIAHFEGKGASIKYVDPD